MDRPDVEETRWHRKTVTLTEEAFQALARRGSRVVPGTELRRSTSRHALYLRGFGSPGVDPATLPEGALDAGVELEGREVVMGDARERDRTRVERPSAGRLTLRRVATCPAVIVRVDDTKKLP